MHVRKLKMQLQRDKAVLKEGARTFQGLGSYFDVDHAKERLGSVDELEHWLDELQTLDISY
jgi:hypothetical protein